jgi:hypothetical protein
MTTFTLNLQLFNASLCVLVILYILQGNNWNFKEIYTFKSTKYPKWYVIFSWFYLLWGISRIIVYLYSLKITIYG